MRDKCFAIRAVILGILTMALGVPPGSLRALARQQDGPQKPAPAQQDQKPASQQSQKPGDQKAQDQSKNPEYQITVESKLVNIDCVVTDSEGNIITGLKKQNFRVLDDGVAQQVTNFSPSDAPITIVMLVEFSRSFGPYFTRSVRDWSAGFLSHLNPKDWVALETFDLKTDLITDFTQDKNEVLQGLSSLHFPGFSESNLYDSVLETVDRLQDVKGKKAILVLASGFDTFSKHTLDQTYKKLRQTDVTIFMVGVFEQYYVKYNIGGISYLQAQNQMSHMASETGGYAWFPRFDGELPSIFDSVTAFLRNQYTVSFTPSNPAKDGKYRKLKVEIVDDNGQPLALTNKKGKKLKTVVYAREGYVAPTATVGD